MIPISYNVRSLLVRRTTSLAAVFGIALVVFVFSASLMLAAGVEKTLSVSGSPTNAIVVRKGSDGELSSTIDNSTLSLIGSAPGVKKDSSGQPVMVGEVVVVTSLSKKGEENLISNVVIRGVPEAAFTFRPEVKMVQGRQPKPGADEAVVGVRIAGRFEGLEIGGATELKKNRPAKIVGIFDSGGSSYESEIWVDAEALASANGRTGSVSTARVQLESAGDFDAFEAAIESDKRLGLEATKETVFYDNQTDGISGLAAGMGGIISFFFAIGAIIGAMITMYASIAHRQREIGTLRALGFRRRTILGSFLLESTLLAVVGGAIGAMAAMALSLTEFSMMNQSTFSEMVFKFTPTPRTMGVAIGVSIVMGVLGGLFPAIRAARMSAIKAMRESV